MVFLGASHLCALFLAFAVTSAQDSPLLNGTDYDYIIVGGGTSGLTVANRLTENGKSTLPFPFFFPQVFIRFHD